MPKKRSDADKKKTLARGDIIARDKRIAQAKQFITMIHVAVQQGFLIKQNADGYYMISRLSRCTETKLECEDTEYRTHELATHALVHELTTRRKSK